MTKNQIIIHELTIRRQELINHLANQTDTPARRRTIKAIIAIEKLINHYNAA